MSAVSHALMSSYGVFGNDSSTKCLLHFNGTDASTTFTDSNVGGSAHTWTASGDAQIDTAQSKFGGASGLFDGTGDAISTPDSADFDLAAGEFTIDCWVRFNTLPTGLGGAGLARIIASQYTSASRGWIFGSENNGGNYRLYFTYQSGSTFVAVGSTISLSTGVWYHLAVVRDNTATDTLRFFLDGVAAGTNTGIDGLTINNSTHTPIIGGYGSLSDSGFDGWIDEFRLSKSARWTTNFLPSGPYTP